MKKISLLTIAVGFTIAAFAWGQTGHRTVGKVAENHLSKKAKVALKEIMGHESLVEASTWMDEIKSDQSFKYANPWHYVAIPEGQTYATAEHAKGGDSYEAIGRMIAILKNPEAKTEEKRNAVRMLVHLVGDFHQPLHVGNGEDRGGNQVKIKWFYKDSNLHRIWDSGMIDDKNLGYSELAEMIDHPKSSNESLYSTDLNVWVSEAVALRPQIYDTGGKDNLTYEYAYKNWATVKNQLFKGGVRLAQILNDIYG
ncbi:MAG: S1/P1 nuclease [Flavobacteriales bacterium]|nr:S1/P1 nuclease [Flavobacteriales bacterium]